MSKKTPESGITRRTFFKSSLAAIATMAGIATLRGDTPQPFQPRPWKKPLRLNPQADHVLWIADPHISPGSQEQTALFNLIANTRHLSWNLIMQLGDLIDEEEDEQANLASYANGLEFCLNFFSQVVHLPGNHCLWGIVQEKLEMLYQAYQLENPRYGVKKLNGYQIVWPDLICPKTARGSFPLERLAWLRRIIGSTPTILAYHYPLAPLPAENHYHFDGHPEKVAVENINELQEMDAFKDLPILAIVHGHVHQMGLTYFQGIPQISLPSLRAEPYAMSQYTVMEVLRNQLLFKFFAEGYATGSLKVVV